MKAYRFGKAELGVSPQLLEVLVYASMSDKTITRSSLSERTGVSLPTAGKVLSTMENCKYMSARLYSPAGGGKPCNHYSLNEALSILVLDLSSDIYSMSIISGYDKCSFYECYAFDPTVGYFDNLTEFLSRYGKFASRYSSGINEICVICDEGRKPDLYSGYSALSMHNKSMVKETLDTGQRIFGKEPNCVIGANAAIREALNYAHDGIPKGSTAYLYIGSTLEGLFCPREGALTPCHPEELMLNGNSTLGDALREAATEEEFSVILSHAVNLMHCAFSPDAYVIESEDIKFTEIFLHNIKRSFALAGKPLPEIFAFRKAPGLAVLGAAKLSAVRSVLSHITSK